MSLDSMFNKTPLSQSFETTASTPATPTTTPAGYSPWGSTNSATPVSAPAASTTTNTTSSFSSKVKEIKNKFVYGTKSTLIYVLGFGFIFGAVVLATTNNDFIKSIYWKLGGGDAQLKEAQAELTNINAEISLVTASLKQNKEEASGKFLELQTAETKVLSARTKITELNVRADEVRKKITTIVNSNVISGYAGDTLYTIGKDAPIQANEYKGNLDKNSFSTLTGATASGSSTGTGKTNSGTVDAKYEIKELLKQVEAKSKTGSGSKK